MDIVFPYRESGIPLSIPKDVEVYQPPTRTPIAETYTAIIKNLLRPLGYKRTLFDMAKKCKSACIAIDAYYPPEVNVRILKPIIKTLHASGLGHDDITVLVTSEYPAELDDSILETIFAPDFINDYNVQTHHVFSDAGHELVGATTSGTPVYVDRRLKDADIKIIAGGIYPHYLFGYAGAPLLLALGLMGPETIQAIYDLADIENLQEFQLFDQTTKFYIELIEIIDLVHLDFIVNIAVDSSLRFTDIFAGKPDRVMKEIATTIEIEKNDAISEQADIVISRTGGAHCDMSWYHNWVSICFSRSRLKADGIIIFVTTLFDELSPGEINDINKTSELIDLFASHETITGTREKTFAVADACTIIFVSPQRDDKS